MSLVVSKVSSIASSFPTTEVEYSDLLTLDYRAGGRGTDGTIDCIGIVLEVYRRAGLGLPDPSLGGGQIFEFQSLWDVRTTADQLYDLVALERSTWHVEIIVRYGLLLGARQHRHVYTQDSSRLLALSGAKVYRLKDAFIPV